MYFQTQTPSVLPVTVKASAARARSAVTRSPASRLAGAIETQDAQLGGLLKKITHAVSKVAKGAAGIEQRFVNATVINPIKKVADSRIAQKALPVAAIAAAVVPGLQVAAPLLRAAAAAAKARSAYTNAAAARKARQQYQRQRSSLVSHLVSQGMPQAQAARAVDLIESGQDPEAAFIAVMGSPAVTAAPASAAAASGAAGAPVPSDRGEVSMQFLDWLKKWHPPLYAAVAERVSSLAGLGDFDIDSIVSAVQDLAPKVLQVYSDKKTLDAQLARARQGLPPIATAPAQQVSTAPGSINWPVWLVVGGLGLGGAFLFINSRRR